MKGWPIVAGRIGIALAACASVAALVQAVAWDHAPFSLLVAAETVPMLPLAIVGASAVRAAPRNVAGWLLLAGGAFMPLGTASYLYARAVFDLGHDLPLAHLAGWLDGWPWVPGQLAIALFLPLLFPGGQLPSRRWRVAIGIDITICAFLLFSTLFDPRLLDWPHQRNPTGIDGGAGDLARGLMAVIALVAPMTLVGAIGFERKQRVTTDPALRAAGRLVRPAVWLLTFSWWMCIALSLLGAPALYALPFESLGISAAGLTCLIAIRRYGLFDARLVIVRGLVYGTLSACVVVVYGVIAVVLARLGASYAAMPIAIVTAAFIALPLRDGLQGVASRLVFGPRDDPVATLLALRNQLERAASAADILPAAARSVQQTLRLQHVAILDGAGIAAESGRDGDGPRMEVPLVYAGERVGALIAVQADGDPPLDAGRSALLTGIAGPIAAALRATALGRELAASHERLVSVTEEERRRLRRDLHDGIGPVLSGAVLGVSRANALLLTRPSAAAQQLEATTAQLQEAIADVRRLVYQLRPPALDHLGLAGALEEQARSIGSFTVTAPASLPVSPAAVEVAAYRIAMEAMTNAVRHAHARTGSVDIRVDGGLHLVVRDDGVGIQSGYRAGIGIMSMRERATELGGTCTVEGGQVRGTVVRAWLPV